LMNKRDILLGLLSGVFIGFSIVIMSAVTKTVHPFVYAVISTAFALPLVLLASMFFAGEGLRKIVNARRRDFIGIFIERGLLGGLLLTFGVSFTLAIRSVFMVQLEPAFVFAWSVLLLKEKVRKSKLFLIATLIIGAFLVTTGGANIFGMVLLGDMLIVIALVLLSHSYILSARVMQNANPMKLALGLDLLGLPVFVLLAVAFVPLAGFLISMENLLLILAASLLFNVIGLPLWLYSFKKLKPWVLASSLVVQTLAGAVLSFVWLGQTLTAVQLIGGAIILISVYLIGSRG